MATYYINGKSWYIQWSENGKQLKKRIGKTKDFTERDIKIVAQTKEIELSTGTRILPSGLIFNAFKEQYLNWYTVEYPNSYYRTEQIIQQHLTPSFGYTAIDSIKPFDAEQYKITRLKKVKPDTVKKELNTLKAMINKACEWQLIDRNPIQYVKAPKNLESKPPQFYSIDDLSVIYQAHDERRFWWQLMTNTGMRRSEAMQLTWNDVESDSIRIVSKDGARTKSGKWREVPLTDSAQIAIKEIKGDGKFVLPRMLPRSLSRHFMHDSKAVGGSVHCLRHTYCSHLVMAGVPLRTVQVLAGHASFTTTERYAHLAPGHLQDAGRAISL